MDTETCSALEQPALDGQQDFNQEAEEETRKENTQLRIFSQSFRSVSKPKDTETTRRVEECLVANVQSTKLEAPQDHCHVAEIHESDVTALSESRALVPSRNSTAAVPPIWFDVCKAIMDLQKENPEALRMLASSAGNRKQAIRAPSAVDTKVQESVHGGKESTAVHSASAEDQTPIVNHKSTVASLEAPVVSDEKPKKTAIVQEQNHQSERRKASSSPSNRAGETRPKRA